MMKLPVAERFKAPQGEGLYAGTPMAFVRFVGCSVGQKVCTACDTDFDRINRDLGGGLYSPEEIVEWARPYEHVCFTGGEPFDRDLRELVAACWRAGLKVHIESSGTVWPDWLVYVAQAQSGLHFELAPVDGAAVVGFMWLTVSPKPGFLPRVVRRADELKLILGGLGDGPGWPTLDDAVRWSENGQLVYVQPRNGRLLIDHVALAEAVAVVSDHPALRLSVQLHKFIRTR